MYFPSCHFQSDERKLFNDNLGQIGKLSEIKRILSTSITCVNYRAILVKKDLCLCSFTCSVPRVRIRLILKTVNKEIAYHSATNGSVILTTFQQN